MHLQQSSRRVVWILVFACIIIFLVATTFIVNSGTSSTSTNKSKLSRGIPIYYSYHISNKLDKAGGPFTSNNTHPLLDGAIINVKWAKVQPARGTFDWSLFDKKISQWTQNGNKKIIVKISFYGQEPEGGKEGDVYDNETTPAWVYETVPRITFVGGGKRTVSVPNVWDPNFSPIFEEFLQGLGEKYNKDSRIAGFIIGPGQNGTILAQGSKNGGKAFIEAGWTLPIWEQHITKVLDVSKKHFKKSLFIIKTSAFLNEYNLTDNSAAAKRVLGYAAMQGISILFRGLDPDYEEFNVAFNPELITYLGTLDPPSGFTLGFFDDWPLWVPLKRSDCVKGPTCGRNEGGLEKEFEYAFQAWDSINRKYPLIFIFQNPEATATNQTLLPCNTTESGDFNDENCFYKPVYTIATQWLRPQPFWKRVLRFLGL